MSSTQVVPRKTGMMTATSSPAIQKTGMKTREGPAAALVGVRMLVAHAAV